MRLSYAEACEELEVSVEASEEQVKEAYKRMALRHHPDRNDDPGSTLKFQRLQAALERIKLGPTAHGDEFGAFPLDEDAEDNYWYDFESELEFLSFLFHNEGFASRRTFFQSHPFFLNPSPTPFPTNKPGREAAAARNRTKNAPLSQATSSARYIEDQLQIMAERQRRADIAERAAERKRQEEQERQAEEVRVKLHLRNAQKHRSAAFLAARTGDSDEVKRKVWEQGMFASEGEVLPGITEKLLRQVRTEVSKERTIEHMRKKCLRTDKENINGATPAGGKKTSGRPCGKVFGNVTHVNGAQANRGESRSSDDVTAEDTDRNETLLHLAVKHGDAHLVQWLLNHGALPEERDSQGFTPYHWSIYLGLVDICIIFEEQCGTPDRAAYAARPPLNERSIGGLAVMSGSWQMVEHVGQDLEEALENLEWVGSLLESKYARPNENDRVEWREVQLALSNIVSKLQAEAKGAITDEPVVELASVSHDHEWGDLTSSKVNYTNASKW
ncbi:hypothetical protein OIV83_000766 [Microbotryomycetes sp. JL201]|nr:hypothetical protein OIV83_000766 [Microbotryomycetes sp. JL201]